MFNIRFTWSLNTFLIGGELVRVSLDYGASCLGPSCLGASCLWSELSVIHLHLWSLVVVIVLLLYVHDKKLWSCRDGHGLVILSG